MNTLNRIWNNMKAFGAKIIADAKNAPDHSAQFDSGDIKSNTLMALCAYISWLVLIPYFLCKDSRYVRFHVNQGLVLAVVESICVVALAVLGSIPFIGIVFRILNTIAKLIFILASCYGVFGVVRGLAKEMPVIGNIHIIK